MAIKSAAVPHYSKSNNKVVYAVRVCPVSPAQEPYTVYRRWDEFLDFSAKLASIFPTSTADDPDPSLYRRIRLSRKVTLFVTTATHTSRRDELDLFVRHLFSLPHAITSFPLVKDFFAIKNNCLDGLSPPSPTPSHTHTFEGPMPTFLSHAPGNSHGGNGKKIHKAKSNDNLLYPTVKERSPSEGGEGSMPTSVFRPTLAAKRSTPDLRRFVSSQAPDFLASNNKTPRSAPPALPLPPLPPAQDDFPTTSLTSSPATSPYPAQLNFRFPRPAPLPPSEASVAVAAESDDVASTRTASTIKPSRSGSTSRISSPLSFMSDNTEENYSSSSASTITPGNYSMKAAPRPGALKHFRSLQDIRAVVTPHPQLPASAQPSPVRGPSFTPAPAPPMARTRSDSRILMKPLPQVREDETITPPPYSAPLSRNGTMSRKGPSVNTAVQPPAHQVSLGSPISPASENRFHRPSISSLRKLQMTSFSSQHQMHNQQQQHHSATSPRSRSNHAQSSSISSLSSTDSAGSFSLSRSTSSGGLGLDFCSSSRESLELGSEHSSSPYMASPDLSAAIAHSPSSASSWQYQGNDYITTNSSRNNNHLPPLPFFPFPAAYEAPKLSRKGSRTRSRASSLHTPVLETILASPVLGGPEPAEPEVPSITLKIMTNATNNNFLMKVSRTSSLKQVRDKVVSKCQTSHIEIDEKQFELVINPGSNKGGAGSTTAGKTSIMFDEATLGSIANLSGTELDQAGIVKLEDEEDWQLAVSLAKTKITLRIL